MTRWRLYGLPSGHLTARPVLRPASADQRMGTAVRRPDRIEIIRPLPELPRDAVLLVEYRDAPDARRSARWSAAMSWAMRTYDL